MPVESKKNSPSAPHPEAALLQPAENVLTVRYRPSEGEACLENPPRFQWIPPQVGRRLYQIELQPLSADGSAAGKPILYSAIPFAFFTPDAPLPTGQYRWRYRVEGDAAGAWSSSRRFTLPASAAEAPFSLDLKRAGGPRPRLAIAPDGHTALRSDPAVLPQWAPFFEKSVTPWIEREIVPEPAPYPNNTRTPALWRESYIACQEALYAIRNLSIAGVLLADDALVEKARGWLLAVAAWDVDGATSRSYNDEAAFRVATALAWGYDWLRTQLSPDEAALVRASLLARGRQVARHAMEASRIETFPFDSHAIRSISAVMVPVGLALAGEDEEATTWLRYAAGYLAGPYSAWADAEGGWAEGIHYWTTAMCYALEAAALLRNCTGLDLFQRPFFRNTGQFPMYCRPAWTHRAIFGDDATLGDPPSPKIGRNAALLAAATANPDLAGYAAQVERFAESDEMAFYNYGWWDFRFDDLLRAASFPEVLPRAKGPEPQMKLFPGVGWASFQTRMDDPAQQIHCLFKSSPYGSISHSHGDQNAFCLSAFGEDLLIQSGHYVAHNSTMHRRWRRQTISKNALLIDGKGQYAEEDKFLARKAAGRIVQSGSAPNHHWAVGDATAAYAAHVPGLLEARREVHQVFGAAFVVIDHIRCEEAVPITWLGHTEGTIRTEELAATIEGVQAQAGIEIAYSSAPVAGLKVVEGFDEVLPEDYAGLTLSRRLEIHCAPARSHTLAVLINPVKRGESPDVLGFIEDQGFGKTLYCLSRDETPVRIALPG
ncbi:heparinase II/III family protein [Pseudoruegeria sp. SHC-113]|uniref:heparinase II/III domain-containing protein n=1 Tax=Pseudoruegeria sp. SHC-113 TaxID=2855439 RepID=UPI0021BB866D|nr:heparinase II/III family protein [Pseudoruegeria sp. SHC-113]MCT8160642.1 heparinase II/III family protein [Pseudoruegeria sp. SHC-113]